MKDTLAINAAKRSVKAMLDRIVRESAALSCRFNVNINYGKKVGKSKRVSLENAEPTAMACLLASSRAYFKSIRLLCAHEQFFSCNVLMRPLVETIVDYLYLITSETRGRLAARYLQFMNFHFYETFCKNLEHCIPEARETAMEYAVKKRIFTNRFKIASEEQKEKLRSWSGNSFYTKYQKVKRVSNKYQSEGVIALDPLFNIHSQYVHSGGCAAIKLLNNKLKDDGILYAIGTLYSVALSYVFAILLTYRNVLDVNVDSVKWQSLLEFKEKIIRESSEFYEFENLKSSLI